MGKPRMIILIRHAQSEGNKNRDIHQYIPDHRVKLTPDGWQQAEDAGRRLRSLLRPDDTLQFFTSPYRRTRETTEGILRTLTSDDPAPSPWKRSTITVYEEPRLREQDFGNFQPCSAEMERMWQERADYGHFFYRIPNGESAADAYDRVSGFNESLWRQFGDKDFPSVCVLVTHGLMTRVFLMKWYHWSVEYFEDLRNVNHCEFITMKRNVDNSKYILQNQLRTWSDLKKRAAASSSSTSLATQHGRATPLTTPASSTPSRKWGGCSNGCNHAKMNFPRRTKRANTQEFLASSAAVAPNTTTVPPAEKEENPEAAQEGAPVVQTASRPETPSTDAADAHARQILSPTSMSGDGDDEEDTHPSSEENEAFPRPRHSLHHGRDFGGSLSGVATPAEGFSDDSDFPSPRYPAFGSQKAPNLLPIREKIKPKKTPKRQMSQAEWEEASGMGGGARADALGDGGDSEDEDHGSEKEVVKGDGITSQVVDGMKANDRKGFDEIY